MGSEMCIRDSQYGWQWAGAGDNVQGEADVVLGVHERIGVGWEPILTVTKQIISDRVIPAVLGIFTVFIFGVATPVGQLGDSLTGAPSSSLTTWTIPTTAAMDSKCQSSKKWQPEPAVRLAWITVNRNVCLALVAGFEAYCLLPRRSGLFSLSE